MRYPGKDKNKKKNPMPQGEETQTSIEIQDQELLQLLVGEQNANLKKIERALEVKASQTPDGVTISGQDSEVELAADLVEQMVSLLENGERFFANDIERAISMLSGNRKLRLEELFRDQVKIAGRKYSITPKTFRQKEYIEAIKSHDIIFGTGPAGTGKTYLAMAMATAALLQKQVKRVVLCRPAVEAGEKLGFLPGDMAEKVNPYLRPLYDALHDMVDYDKADEMIERGQIEVAPLAFMRGRTLSNAFVVLDEAQNTTPVQMKMLLTRLGHNSKCVITGDDTQIDLPRGVVSGLTDATNVLKDVRGISFIRFSDEDVIRHPLVSKVVHAYKKRDDQIQND